VGRSPARRRQPSARMELPERTRRRWPAVQVNAQPHGRPGVTWPSQSRTVVWPKGTVPRGCINAASAVHPAAGCPGQPSGAPRAPAPVGASPQAPPPSRAQVPAGTPRHADRQREATHWGEPHRGLQALRRPHDRALLGRKSAPKTRFPAPPGAARMGRRYVKATGAAPGRMGPMAPGIPGRELGPAGCPTSK